MRFRHLVRIPSKRFTGEIFRARPTGRSPLERPRTGWRDYVSRLAWERLGIPPEELNEVAGERKVCFPAQAGAPATRPWISGGRWMDEL